MKSYAILTAAVVAFASNAAQANLVKNYSGSDVNLGTVVIGQTGTITENSNVTTDIIYGSLPGMSKIIFTYTITDILTGHSGASSGDLRSSGSYDYTGTTAHYGHGLYTGTSTANSDSPKTIDKGFFKGKPSLPMVWATANLKPFVKNTSTGTTSIQNNNATALVKFESLFSANQNLFSQNICGASHPGETISVTYRVSAIPLPAAFSLFGTVIAGMFGFAQFRRRKNSLVVA